VTLEEHSLIGGFGSAVAEHLADHPPASPVRLRRFGAADRFSHTCGDQAFHRKANGLEPEQIAQALVPLLS
jgi:transketolase